MDAGPSSHPTGETLQEYVLGKLGEGSAEVVRAHLKVCSECRRQVIEMSASSSAAPTIPPTESTAADDAIVDSSSSPVMSAAGYVDATADASGDVNDSSLPKGTRVGYFGDYELLKVLGEGGMGIVYEARQLSLNRPVALKMFKASRFPSADEVRRFQNESEAVARLDHPNIVPVFEVGQYEDQHYFSMKLIAGESFDKRPKDYLANPCCAAELVTKMAGAIHHAHQRGILHRDLKPANILIDSEGEPHVTDFGLAKRLEGDSELTRSGAILGTPAYMAPERASGKRGAVTTATDVYGLGVVLYALLTGSAPFGGDSVIDTLEQVRERLPEPPTKRNPRVPRDMEVICLKCLEKDPCQRYASADALAEDLRRWLAGEPIAARPVGNAARLWMWCRRNRVMAVSAGLVAASLVGVALLSLLYADRQARLAVVERLRAAEQIQHAQKDAENAVRISAQSDHLRKRTEDLTISLAELNRRIAEMNLERGQAACQEGQIGLGLLWMVESLRIATLAEDVVWKRVALASLSRWQSLHPRLMGLFDSGSVTTVALTRDGKTVLTSGLNANDAQLWDTATGLPIGKRIEHPASAAAFSPDGKAVITVRDHEARLWDAATGLPIGKAFELDGAVFAVAFGFDGKTILTGSDDGTARWHDFGRLPVGRSLAYR
jgi:tRNA A-37 threonylcarbamoyl transferase component Bud32